ncbi:TetR/AcrR family transcriptional regulator [Mycobacterium sp.]|uniref:TetR/AcrR family transcriptional regulator n=1 Tax=Mycobacterium sp. TaxID=1785 RepID=UPI003F9AAF96
MDVGGVAGQAELTATQILGMALCRFVLRLPPVIEMSRDEIVEWLGPTIQRYLGLPEGTAAQT